MFYLINITDEQAQHRSLAINGDRVLPGEQYEFTVMTADVVLHHDDGYVRVYDAQSDALVNMNHYSVAEVEVPLDDEILETLPPELQDPLIRYVVIYTGPGGDNYPTVVPSTDLREHLRFEVGIGSVYELVTWEEAVDITELTVSDLTGLDRCRRLCRLEAAGVGATQIGPLDQMYGLRHLNLASNALTSVEGIEELPEIRRIFLSGNPLDDFDISPVIRGLRMLDLSGCSLSQETIDRLVGRIYDRRHRLANNNPVLLLSGNARPSAAMQDRINGTGDFLDEGLRDQGFFVSYDQA